MPVALEKILVRPTQSIREILLVIDEGGAAIALVVDENRRLLGTVTDGDVRRAILENTGLDEPVSKIMPRLFTAMQLGTPADELLKTMQIREIKQIPLTDPQGRVVDIALMQDLVSEPSHLPNSVVIMAGGAGTRLRPITESIPKPLLQIGNRPLLEIMIQRLADQGFRNFLISVHHLSDLIEQHFEDGSRFGVQIQYLREKEPLGTAGSLQLVRHATYFHPPVVVVNGDLLTKVNFRDFLDFHFQCGNECTMGISQYDLQLPFGVVHRVNLMIERIEEKPVYQFSVFAGVAVLERNILELIPEGRYMDMTELANEAIENGHRVGSFPIREYWLDIGRMEDFGRANRES